MEFAPNWVFSVLVLSSMLMISVEHRRRRFAKKSCAEASRSGMDEPTTLHPYVHPEKCLGCSSCVNECPEKNVLQLVDGRAKLVYAAHCVGHGLCKTACAADAIDLVLGTKKNPIEVPRVDEYLQTNVQGLYVAGELGGQGLIRNAILQGIRAVEHIKNSLQPVSRSNHRDVAIVGAGPAGIAAALACRQYGLSCYLLDQEGLGGSVNHYPRQKLVMTQPVDLPFGGRMHFRHVSKEQLLEFWRSLVKKADLEVQAPTKVQAVRRSGDAFVLQTNSGELVASRVVLSLGRRGVPRKLGVSGEALEKVSYQVLEPEQYEGSRVLVVGGGNSAVEAATSLVVAGAQVTLSYRGSQFKRVAPLNQQNLDKLQGAALEIELNSNVVAIEKDRVLLSTPGGKCCIQNDFTIVLIGGELPTAFLKQAGITVATHKGQPQRPKAMSFA